LLSRPDAVDVSILLYLNLRTCEDDRLRKRWQTLCIYWLAALRGRLLHRRCEEKTVQHTHPKARMPQ
jgi:hypothetical protein